jgi:hypothetical protein
LRAAPALGAIAAALLLCASSPASALVVASIPFDLSGGGDFGPTGTMGGSDCTVSSPGTCLSHTDSISGLTLTLAARTLIPDDQDVLDGQTGVVLINDLGAGVKATPSSGSKEISGGGKHQDEALDFALSMPVLTDSVMITVTSLDFGDGSKKKDDGFVYVGSAGSSPILVLRDQILRDALTPVPGEEGTFVLSFPDAVSQAMPTLDFVSFRATDGHILLSSFQAVPFQPVITPEPTTLGLLGMGLVGVGLARSRRPRVGINRRR